MNFEKNSNINFKGLLIFVLFSVLMIIVVLSCIKNIVIKEKSIRDTVYNKALGYSISSINLEHDSEQKDGGNLLKSGILSLLGIGDNYFEIVGREIAYIDNRSKVNDLGGRDSQDEMNRFTLNEDQVYEEENISNNNGNMNSAPVFSPEFVKQLQSKPEVLIYHTHTCESYEPYGNNNVDKDKNITLVGEELKKELEKYGIAVIHDTTIHDIASYNDSYERSRVTLDKYLKQYKNFKLIIDMHRDSVEDKGAVTTTINGENVARFSFVMTRKNPFFNEQLKLVEKIREISNKLYPGDKSIQSFNKSTFYYNYGKKYYNQDASSSAILMELGSQVNTIDEAKGSTKYLARILAEYINGKN